MAFYKLPSDTLRVGDTVPFDLRDKFGQMLVPKGTVVASESLVALLTERELYVDESDGETLKRAMYNKIDSMVRSNALLGQIAQARPESFTVEGDERRAEGPVDAWARTQSRLNLLLRDPTQVDFLALLDREQRYLLALTNSDPDIALLLLINRAMQEVREYSVCHSMLVAVVCELAARQIPGWPEEWLTSLRCAALTMNIGMTQLQNQLAAQEQPPSPQQRAEIRAHALQSVVALRAAGVKDELWLQAVELHHSTPPGALAGRLPREQLARLIQRVDIFAARLSRRKQRAALPASAAAKAIYLDEAQKPDEAGSAVIRAIGIYPPGCLVRLASGEVAIVLRRGERANEPRVASLMNSQGLPLAEPILRKTSLRNNAVTGGVTPAELKVLLNMESLVRLA